MKWGAKNKNLILSVLILLGYLLIFGYKEIKAQTPPQPSPTPPSECLGISKPEINLTATPAPQGVVLNYPGAGIVVNGPGNASTCGWMAVVYRATSGQKLSRVSKPSCAENSTTCTDKASESNLIPNTKYFYQVGIIGINTESSTGCEGRNFCSNIVSTTFTGSGTSPFPPCPTDVKVESGTPESGTNTTLNYKVSWKWDWPGKVWASDSKVSFIIHAKSSASALADIKSEVKNQPVTLGSYSGEITIPPDINVQTTFVWVEAEVEGKLSPDCGKDPPDGNLTSLTLAPGGGVVESDEESPCVKEACLGTTPEGKPKPCEGVTILNFFLPRFWSCLFCRMGCFFVELIGNFVETVIEWLNKVSGLSDSLIQPSVAYAAPLADQLKSPEITKGWTYSRYIVNIIVIFGLLLIAFANILRLNIDIYMVKRSLPYLIIGVILANVSLLICRVIVDFASLLSDFFINQAATFASGTTISKDTIGTYLVTLMGIRPNMISWFGAGALVSSGILLLTGVGAMISCLPLLLLAFFLLIPGLVLLALTFLMFARLYVVWILTILAPLAFICLGIPPLQGWFSRWWSWFLKWVFLAPAAYFFIGLGAVLGSTILSGAASQGAIGALGGWILGMVILILSIYMPFKSGGAIMAVWSNIGRRLGRAGGGAADTALYSATGGRFSVYGTVKGWTAAWQRARKHKLDEMEARGRVGGEVLMSLPRTIPRGIREAIRAPKGTSPWERVRRIGEPARQRGELARGSFEAEQFKRILEDYRLDYHGDELQSILEQAIDTGDFQIAASALVQLAGERFISPDIYQRFQQRFPSHPLVENALRWAQEASIHSPYGPSPLPGANADEIDRLFSHALSGKHADEQRAILARFVNRPEISDIVTNNLPRSSLTPHQENLLQVLVNLLQVITGGQPSSPFQSIQNYLRNQGFLPRQQPPPPSSGTP